MKYEKKAEERERGNYLSFTNNEASDCYFFFLIKCSLLTKHGPLLLINIYCKLSHRLLISVTNHNFEDSSRNIFSKYAHCCVYLYCKHMVNFSIQTRIASNLLTW